MDLEDQVIRQPSYGLRGIIICTADGGIRCAGSLANSWLKKYFPMTASRDELPPSIHRWLNRKDKAKEPLRMEKNGDKLVITLLESDFGPPCLLFEETGAINRWCAATQHQLTRREAEVLSWVAQGKANWAIGKILNLSPGTVRKHLQHIYSKLGVENRTAAALCALQLFQ
jgi:DNA-binding CsgD family transcriptional regulator